MSLISVLLNWGGKLWDLFVMIMGLVSCPGAKKALDDFFSNKEEIIKVPTGQAFIIKR